MNKKIMIVGHYGANCDLVDGQTVKVRSLVTALKSRCPEIDITIVDTYYIIHKRILYFCYSLLLAFFSNNYIIFFPAARGRKYMFVFFYYVSKLTRKNVFHDCIAGSLDYEITMHPIWVKYLNSYCSNWMESPQQVQVLKRLGVNNAVYMPNFKNLSPVDITNPYIPDETIFRFCIFSRLLPMKGIEDALEAVDHLSKTRDVSAKVDIYGPVESGQESWFASLTSKYSDVCCYKGVVPYEHSVDVLKDYFALLFPTRFYTEGMPGTIIDAMFAGLPVIARRWAWCDNMITDGFNGISYDFNRPELLYDILVQVVDNPSIIVNMKSNCVMKSSEYSPEYICKKILIDMNL